MKRMEITKGNVINCLCLLCWKRVEGLLNHCWCNFMFVWLWTLRCYENCHLLIICVNLSSALFWGMGLTSVMCIEKEWVLKRMYHFEGRIAHRDGYYISRDVSRAVTNAIIEGRVVRRDRCMDRYVPHGSRAERQQVCITRSDMHHYAWHCIPLHCTYLSLVNLISYFADLLIAFLRNLWLINIEHVIADM